MEIRPNKPFSLTVYLHSLIVSVAVFILYFLWFLVLDRRLIFLYGHRHTTPFDADTASRYWMTGLVAGGVVLLANVVSGFLLRMLYRDMELPDWRRVWKNVCFILAVPILVLLLFIGRPAIALPLSLWIMVVLFASIGLALYAGSFIVRRFRESVWLFFEGLALVPVLQILPLAIDYGIRRSLPSTFIIAPLILIFAALLWLFVMTLLHKPFKQPFASQTNIFLSGLVVLYLLLPLVHYANSRPGYIRYISNSANFFAREVWVQVAALLMAAGVLRIAGKWRKQNSERSLKTLVFWLTAFAAAGYLIMGLAAGKETDIWKCEGDRWVKQGNPPYEKPFPEECGIIDKAMGL